MRFLAVFAAIAGFAIAGPALAQDADSASEPGPGAIDSELERLSRELDELRAELEELHSGRLRELRIELDSMQLDLAFPEDFDWPSLEEVRRQWELVPFDMDSVVIWSDSARREFGRNWEEMAERQREWVEEWTTADGFGVESFNFIPDPPLLLGARRVSGAELSELNSSLGRYFGADEGVLVTDVTEGSPAAEAGLEPGDVVTGADGRPIREIGDLRGAVSAVQWARLRRAEESSREVRLEILREGETMEVVLEVGE